MVGFQKKSVTRDERVMNARRAIRAEWNAVCSNALRTLDPLPAMNQQVRAEYAFLLSFAEEQAALIERFKRTGAQAPTQLEWHGAEAYLRDLRAAAEAAEQRRARRAGPIWRRTWSLLERLFPWSRSGKS